HRASEVVGVSFPNRTIEVVVMPYERATRVVEANRQFEEIVSKGAFDGVQRRANRIRVNREHDRRYTIGGVRTLHPSPDEGLVAEIRFPATPLGDETLELANDGFLDGSAGFGVMDRAGAEVGEPRPRRRLNHLWLDHVAMTASPAYEDAKVLAV